MKDFLKSFRHALHGLRYALREERNFQIEMVVALMVVALLFVFPLSALERAVVVAMTVLVLSLELLNTALERVLDMLKPQVHPYVRIIKDLVASAVLVAATGALAVGLLVFLGK